MAWCGVAWCGVVWPSVVRCCGVVWWSKSGLTLLVVFWWLYGGYCRCGELLSESQMKEIKD